jgi:hypothetical protein
VSARLSVDPRHAGTGTAALASRTARVAALALILGGIADMVVHVLYGIGHGRTVVNENKEVLGLTNDTWARVGAVGTTMLVLGLVVIRSTDTSRLMRWATSILLVGLALRAAADWVFNLYVPAELLLLVGRAVLVVALATGSVLPRWSAMAMALTVAAWVVFISFTDAVFDASTEVAGMTVAGNDLLRFVTAAAWVCLGAALHRVARQRPCEC